MDYEGIINNYSIVTGKRIIIDPFRFIVVVDGKELILYPKEFDVLYFLARHPGLSQDELGQRIGVSRQTISKWELAKSYPDFQRLVR